MNWVRLINWIIKLSMRTINGHYAVSPIEIEEKMYLLAACWLCICKKKENSGKLQLFATCKLKSKLKQIKVSNQSSLQIVLACRNLEVTLMP